MMIWNDTTAGWYHDGSDYTGFSRKLAELVLKSVTPGGTLCDLGCGLSLVDIELSPYFSKITCVDESEYAVDDTLKTAQELRIKNITAECHDARSLTGQFDTVMCLFHGNIEEYVGHYMTLAKRCFITAVHDDPEELVKQKKHRVRKLTSLRETTENLKNLGLDFTVERCSLEFGQPFRSQHDAEYYVEYYHKNEDGQTMAEYLRDKLVSTNDPTFPLYLPQERRFAIIKINKGSD